MDQLFQLLFLPLFLYIILASLYLFAALRLGKRTINYISDQSVFGRVRMLTMLISFIICILGIVLTNAAVSSRKYNFKDESNALVSSIAHGLESSFSIQEQAVLALSQAAEIKSVFSNEGSISAAYELMDRYKAIHQASVIYIMDVNGDVLLSTNRNDADSFLNKNYSYRPYFKTASGGRQSSYIALGSTSGKRGYYTAVPIIFRNGLVGVLAVKKDIEDLEFFFMQYEGLFLADENGVVFFSSDPEFLFTLLPDIQYQKEDFSFLTPQYSIDNEPSVLYQKMKGSDEFITFKDKEMFLFTSSIRNKYWTLIYLHSIEELAGLTVFFIIMTALTFIAVFFVSIVFILIKTNRSLTKVVLSDKWFRSLFEKAPEVIFIVNKTTQRIVAINKECQNLFGWSEQEFKTFSYNDILFSEPLVHEFPDYISLRTKKKTQIIVRINTTDILFQNADCSLYYIKDLTAELHYIEVLKQSEEKYRSLAENLPETVFEVNGSRKLMYLNNTGKRLFKVGDDEVGNLSMDTFVKEGQREQFVSCFSSMHAKEQNNWTEFTFSPVGGIQFTGALIIITNEKEEGLLSHRGLIIDLSAKKEMEIEIRKNEKLESMGLLAGGLAHDFNNLLTVIKAGVSLLDFSLKDTEHSDTLGQINTAVSRGNAITKQLLTFSPGGDPVKEAVDGLHLILDLLTVVFSGTDIKIELSVSENIPSLFGDSTQISEVFQNLFLNARQAMPVKGIFSLTAKELILKKKNKYNVPQGEYLEFVISDTGDGIAEDKVSNIFDPFFTTKDSGSGLGLAISHSIVKRHHGFISVHSELNHGTDFTIVLPSTKAEAVNDSAAYQQIIERTGSILLMDDDVIIRKVGRKLLTKLGYSVETAKNGEDALEMYEDSMRKGQRFDAVIMDLTVPGAMGGKDAVQELLKLDPGAKAIVSSGYSVDPVLADYKTYGFVGIAEKPYSITQLSLVISNVLDL